MVLPLIRSLIKQFNILRGNTTGCYLEIGKKMVFFSAVCKRHITDGCAIVLSKLKLFFCKVQLFVNYFKTFMFLV